MSSSKYVYNRDRLAGEIFGQPETDVPDEESELIEPAAPDDYTEQIDSAAISPAEPGLEQEIQPNKVLTRYDMVGDADKIQKRNLEKFCILLLLAQKGRWTVIYAAPNVGKTLFTFALLTKTLQKHPAIASSVFYVNADDNIDGVIDKAFIAGEWGFFMLVPGYKDFNIRELQGLINKLCQSGQAHLTIIIVDTLKKAVDLMKKSQLRAFGECIRRFVSQGGTFITLAHTNKNVGADGKPIPEGTADIINDADCVYLAYEVAKEASTRTVMLECRKTRGGDLPELYLQYSTEPNLTYQELLSTVEVIDGAALEEFKPVPPPTAEDVIVSAICNAITEGVNTKMRIRDHASEVTGASKREVIRVIEQYTGSDPEVHMWTFTRGERGRQQFQLLPAQPSRISDSADSQISGQNGEPTSTQNPTETTITY